MELMFLPWSKLKSRDWNLWCRADIQRGAALLAVNRQLTLWIRNDPPLILKKKKEVILNSVTVTFSTFLQFILCRVVHQYNKFRLRNRAHLHSFSCIGHRIFYSPLWLHILELKSASIVLEVPQSRPEGPKKSDWMSFFYSLLNTD